MEKTNGKTKGTIANYENGLSYLVDYFSTLEEGIGSLNACSKVSWELLISKIHLDLNNNLTVSQKKAILSTINTFVRWLDKRYDTNYSDIYSPIIIESEKEFLQITNSSR